MSERQRQSHCWSAAAEDSVSAALPVELRAIVGGLSGESVDGSLDWDRFARLAAAHGVVPLLHAAWNQSSTIIPQTLLTGFGEERRQNALLAARSRHQRDQVVRLFKREDIPCLILKGAALAQTWYGDASLRPCIDIDILVHPDDVDRSRCALLRDGYRERSGFRVGHHELPLVHPDQPCAIELHHRLTSLPIARQISFEDLLADSITISGEGVQIRTLGPEDTLLHLCLHLLGHIESSEGWRLRHLWDIALHLKTCAIDWDDFGARARTAGVSRGCSAVLGLVTLLTEAPIPSEVSDTMAARDLLRYPLPGPIEHHLLGAFVASLRRRRLRQAMTMIVRSMYAPASLGERVTPAARPYRLISQGRRIMMQAMKEPRSLRTQVSLWMAQSRDEGQLAEVVRDLLAPAPEDQGS